MREASLVFCSRQCLIDRVALKTPFGWNAGIAAESRGLTKIPTRFIEPLALA